MDTKEKQIKSFQEQEMRIEKKDINQVSNNFPSGDKLVFVDTTFNEDIPLIKNIIQFKRQNKITMTDSAFHSKPCI